MPKIETSVNVTVSGSPETVFAVLSDPTRMSEWMNGVESAEWEEGSDSRAGNRFKMKYKYNRKVHDITMEIIAVEPGSLLEFKTIEGPFPIQARYTLRPAADRTVLTYHQTAYSDSMLAAVGFVLTSWLAKPMVRRVLRKDLEKLSEAVRAGNRQD